MEAETKILNILKNKHITASQNYQPDNKQFKNCKIGMQLIEKINDMEKAVKLLDDKGYFLYGGEQFNQLVFSLGQKFR